MKKVLLFLAEGFEEIETLTVVDVLRRANIECNTCSIKDYQVTGAHSIEVKADLLIKEVKIDNYDAVVLPGGMPGANNLKENEKVVSLVQNMNSKNKIVAAICAAPIVLAKADIIKGKNITSYPSFEKELEGCNYKEEIVVQDGNIITSRGPATAIYFALKLVEVLRGMDIADELGHGMLINKLFKD